MVSRRHQWRSSAAVKLPSHAHASRNSPCPPYQGMTSGRSTVRCVPMQFCRGAFAFGPRGARNSTHSWRAALPAAPVDGTMGRSVGGLSCGHTDSQSRIKTEIRNRLSATCTPVTCNTAAFVSAHPWLPRTNPIVFDGGVFFGGRSLRACPTPSPDSHPFRPSLTYASVTRTIFYPSAIRPSGLQASAAGCGAETLQMWGLCGPTAWSIPARAV